MKQTLLCSALVLTGLSASMAQNTGPANPPNPARGPQPAGREERPMEKRTFLGVATGPVDPAVRAQLGIARGVGLTIRHVDRESPAGKALQEYDVLTKFNDQILISHEQLAVLVENSKPGDNVNLTLVRGGQEQAVTVTLAEHEVPKRPEGSPFMGMHPWMGQNQPWREAHERMESQMKDMHRRMGPPHEGGRENGRPQGDDASRRGQPEREMRPPGVRNSTWVENQVTLNLIENASGRRLTILDGGKEVFSGPVNSEEERAQIPEAYRDTFKRLETGLRPENGREKEAAGPDKAKTDESSPAPEVF